MKSRIIGASYERAKRLMEADCPIDNLNALPRRSFGVEQLPGYGDSRVYKLGPLDAGWVIPLRLRTDRPSGTIISDWDFEPPWQNVAINWDFEPEEIIPIKDQDDYKHLFKSRLMGVLNEGCPIRRGCPVEGVLCGHSFQPIGESSHGLISANLASRTISETRYRFAST